jgi:hypothetical protein
MPHQYIEAIDEAVIANPQSIFLAGGITGCGDWQKKAAKELKSFEHLTVINPRREDFDVSKKEESVKQIAWEYKRLRQVNQILFWFTESTLQPITLYELGATLERNAQFFSKPSGGQRIFIGADMDYERLFDVHIQAKMKSYPFDIPDSLEYLLAMVKVYNKNLEIFKDEE